MLIGVLLEVTKETFNPVIKYHALEWLEVFTQLFYNQLVKKDFISVRHSFRGEMLLKQMKQPKNPQRTSKILSLIRQQTFQADSQLGQQSLNILNGIDFLPTPRQKQKSCSVIEQKMIQQDQNSIAQEVCIKKAQSEYQIKVSQFLVQIFLSYYNQIIILVMHSFSDQDEKIRRITTKINNILLDSFPVVQDKAKISKADLPIPTIITTQSQNYLQKLEVPLIIKLGKFLKQSRTSHKIQAIIKWIKILYEKGTNPQLNLQISSLIQKIVQKICQKPSSSHTNQNSSTTSPSQKQIPNPYITLNFNSELFHLLSDSIFMQKYLDLFIETLLSYLYQNQNIDSQRILIDLISMKIKVEDKAINQALLMKNNQVLNTEQIEKDGGQQKGEQGRDDNNNNAELDSTELIYITILRRLMHFQAEKGKFKQKMIQNIITILITQQSLSSGRKKLRNTKLRQQYTHNHKFNTYNHIQRTKQEQEELNKKQMKILNSIKLLFGYFCLNQAFSIIFCFLTGMYSLISKILKYIAQQNLLDRQRIKSFIKASNLLQCYNLNHVKIDLLKNTDALKAYLGYLMVIPPSKLNKILLNRFPEDFVLQQEQEDLFNRHANPAIDNFQEELFQIYLKNIQKQKQQIILMEKMEQKRKQRQRQASLTNQLVKQFPAQFKRQSKSILKQTSKKFLNQSRQNQQLRRSNGLSSDKYLQPSYSQRSLHILPSQRSLQPSQSQSQIKISHRFINMSQTSSQQKRNSSQGKVDSSQFNTQRKLSQSNALSENQFQLKIYQTQYNAQSSESMDVNQVRKVVIEQVPKKKKKTQIKVINMQIQ